MNPDNESNCQCKFHVHVITIQLIVVATFKKCFHYKDCYLANRYCCCGLLHLCFAFDEEIGLFFSFAKKNQTRKIDKKCSMK